MKKANFFIHYEPIDSESMDLDVFGKSVIWFNYLLKEIYAISNIEGDVDIKALQPKKGSIIVQILIEISLHQQCIFNHLADLQNFLQATDINLLHFANEYFTQFWYSLESQISFWERVINGETTGQIALNKFEAERWWEFWLLTASWISVSHYITYTLLPKFFRFIIQKTKNIKEKSFPDEDVPREYFGKMKHLSKKYKKPFKPLREWEVSEIAFSLDWEKKRIPEQQKVTSKNFWDYLPKDQEYLPQYQNWIQYDFIGEIKNFQSSRGDFLKIQIRTDSWKSLLTAKPWEWHTTEEFIQFYKKNVKFRAEVLRESIFQIPKLKIVSSSMELEQSELF